MSDPSVISSPQLNLWAPYVLTAFVSTLVNGGLLLWLGKAFVRQEVEDNRQIVQIKDEIRTLNNDAIREAALIEHLSKQLTDIQSDIKLIGHGLNKLGNETTSIKTIVDYLKEKEGNRLNE